MGRSVLPDLLIGGIKPGDIINGILAIRFHHLEKVKNSLCVARRPYWVFKCFCGKKFISRVEAIKSGRTLSCGCLRIERLRKKIVKHGLCGTHEYQAWQSMKDRCNNKNNSEYKNYGERGISVCNEWQASFSAFINDMGKKPTSKHEIDRIDNSKGYFKKNCRWATKSENMRNARTSRTWFIHGHRFKTAQLAAIFYGVNHETIRYWCGLRGNSPLPLCYSVLVY